MSRYNGHVDRGNDVLIFFSILFGMVAFSLLAWALTRTVYSIQFNRNCGGNLVRASHANTIELAEKELETAVKYMENNKLTEGFTSILYNTPDEDVGFWYTNMTNSLTELKSLKKDATPLEKSNMLIKLRESIVVQNKEGSSLVVPEGISVYPYNTAFFIWGWASFVLCCLVSVPIIYEANS